MFCVVFQIVVWLIILFGIVDQPFLEIILPRACSDAEIGTDCIGHSQHHEGLPNVFCQATSFSCDPETGWALAVQATSAKYAILNKSLLPICMLYLREKPLRMQSVLAHHYRLGVSNRERGKHVHYVPPQISTYTFHLTFRGCVYGYLLKSARVAFLG